jgi:hypothetical protein
MGNNLECPCDAECDIDGLDPVSLWVRPELIWLGNDPDGRDRRIPFFILDYRLGYVSGAVVVVENSSNSPLLYYITLITERLLGTSTTIIAIVRI